MTSISALENIHNIGLFGNYENENKLTKKIDNIPLIKYSINLSITRK